MNLLRYIKRIAALTLMAAFFLPLSQCNGKIDTNGKANPPMVFSAVSAYEWPSIGSTAALLLFSWPLAAQVAALRRRTPSCRKVSFIAEVGLSLVTIYGIYIVSVWGRTLRYGIFFAYGGIASYLISAIVLFVGTRPPLGNNVPKDIHQRIVPRL